MPCGHGEDDKYDKCMPIDPIVYQDISARAAQRRYQDLVFHWKAVIVYIVAAMVWLIVKTDVRREPELPNRPLARADAPLLKEKVSSVPQAAHRYGVAVGETVDISAVTPPMALNRATITAMDNDQLTVRAGSDSFTVRWENLIHLKKTSSGK